MLYDTNPIPVKFSGLELLDLLNKLSHLQLKITSNPNEEFNVRMKLPQTENSNKRHLYAFNKTQLLCWLVDLDTKDNKKRVNACLNFNLKNENIEKTKRFVFFCLNHN